MKTSAGCDTSTPLLNSSASPHLHPSPRPSMFKLQIKLKDSSEGLNGTMVVTPPISL